MADVIGRRIEELDTPVLLLDLDALERNIQRFAAEFRAAGVAWRPHTKGQKAPAIAHLELAAGAIGVTCAKLGEAEVMAAAGIRDILIANQVVGPAKATRLVNLRRHADVIVAIDSAENAAELDAAARAKGVRVRAVVEVDLGMRRCGVLPGPPALELARQVAACRGLEFVGLMGWEGHARRPGDPDERRRNIEAAVGLLVETAELCRRAGLPVAIVSCGGTGTHQVAARVPGVTEIQAGGGVFGDRYYRRNYALDHEPALTVLTTIVSRPAPDRIVVDAGKKTMSADLEAPEPLGLEGVQRVRLSAEHGTIDLAEPNDRVRVGDRITFAVGYSDTTTCLHDEFLGVRDGRVEVVWPILGRGKLR